jgi:hypothetical protein
VWHAGARADGKVEEGIDEAALCLLLHGTEIGRAPLGELEVETRQLLEVAQEGQQCRRLYQ